MQEISKSTRQFRIRKKIQTSCGTLEMLETERHYIEITAYTAYIPHIYRNIEILRRSEIRLNENST